MAVVPLGSVERLLELGWRPVVPGRPRDHRARVAELSVEEVEHLYAMRVSNETLALGLSVPRFTATGLDELDGLVDAVAAAESQGFDVWEDKHHRFPMTLVAHAGERTLRSMVQWAEHAGRYRRLM